VTVATTGLWLYLPAVALGALTGECWLACARRGQPSGNLPSVAYWILARSVTVVLFAAYFGLMAMFGGGIAWTAHLWAGTVVAAGLFAVTTSILFVPPPWVGP
jgi:hypothetical protein